MHGIGGVLTVVTALHRALSAIVPMLVALALAVGPPVTARGVGNPASAVPAARMADAPQRQAPDRPIPGSRHKCCACHAHELAAPASGCGVALHPRAMPAGPPLPVAGEHAAVQPLLLRPPIA